MVQIIEMFNSKFTNYQEGWVGKFEREKRKLQDVFVDSALEIEHIGSTSIPGLSAKLIIDIAVLVESIDNISKIVSTVSSLGCKYEPSMSSAERFFLGKEALLNTIYRWRAQPILFGHDKFCLEII